MGSINKRRRLLRNVIASVLFVCILFGQAYTSAGQSDTAPASAAALPPHPAVPRPRSRPAGWGAHAPLTATLLHQLVERRELQRARATAASVTPVIPVAKQKPRAPALPLGFTPVYSVYMPAMVRQSRGVYGYVNLNGAPTAGITVELRLYDGSANSTVAVAATDGQGYYAFPGRAGLGAGQQYWVRYQNAQGQPGRLSSWVTQAITSYMSGADYALGAFDIADARLGSPGPAQLIAPPSVFTWTMRTTVSTDSYEIDVFDPAGIDPSYSTGALGYISETSIITVPPGLSLLKTYGWALGIHSQNGGFGTSYYYNPFMFSKPSGVQGRVMLNGANISGITVTLVLWDGSSDLALGETTTGADGIYQFTAAPSLHAGQVYYVRYNNSTDPSRLFVWVTASVPSYTAGGRAYAGNFDLANILLTSPNGAGLSSPYTFRWVRRAIASDSYCVQVFTTPSDPNPKFFASPFAGYVGALSLNNIPAGFAPNVIYGWNVCAASPDGGVGASYQSLMFSFN